MRACYDRLMATFTKPRYIRARSIRLETLEGTRVFTEMYNRSLQVINNWRSAHSDPLNTFQMDLRNKAKAIQSDALVAQRTKRLPSIQAKLSRQKTLHLTQMQDIGGCRAIVNDMQELRELVGRYEISRFEHKLHNSKDYIAEPHCDGYRGHHLIYRYRGRGDKAVWNDLRIEIQLRTSLQHVWATAVEAVDLFTGQALKFKQGQPRWERFFALMSCIIAAKERCPEVPGCPGNHQQIVAEIRNLTTELHAEVLLSGIGVTLEHMGRSKTRRTKYFFVRLDLEQRKATVRHFNRDESTDAHTFYLKEEKKYAANAKMQVFMVSVDKILFSAASVPEFLSRHQTLQRTPPWGSGFLNVGGRKMCGRRVELSACIVHAESSRA